MKNDSGQQAGNQENNLQGLFPCFKRKRLAVWTSCADGKTRLVSIYFEIRAIVGFPAGLSGNRRAEQKEESGRIISVLLE